MLNFGEYERSTKEKLQNAIKYWKRLMVATGDAQKTLSVTYKAIGRSILNYGAPIWASTISNTNWNHLKTQQNIALRTVTGCVKVSDINELHNEGEILPVKPQTQMLAEQFLTGSYQSHRADHETTSSISLRPMRQTLNETYWDRVTQHANNKEQLNRKAYKNVIKSIHRHTVHTQLNKDSKQICTPPPKMAEEEQQLHALPE